MSSIMLIILSITGLFAISPFLLLLPLPFLFKDKKSETAREPKVPLDKKIKEKVKQKKVAQSIQLDKLRIKKGILTIFLKANENLNVDYLIISLLDKNLKVLQQVKKEKFTIQKDKSFSIEVPLKFKQILTKYIDIEVSTGGGVKSKIRKKLKFLNLV